jgi:hypothetical protein
MAIAKYKDLCIDAVDPERLGRFWARVLQLDFHALDDGDAKLTGPGPEHTVWVNRVPEPVTVKQRFHLDVRATSPEAVEEWGATLVDRDTLPWVVMKDPEGGELCVFGTGHGKPAGLMELVLDTGPDPRPIADWWAQLFGVPRRDEQDGEDVRFSYLEGIPGAPFESLVFVPVPEPKTVKNRIHVDVTTVGIADLEAVGATVLRAQDDEIRWTVMADPDGNEFCAFVGEG